MEPILPSRIDLDRRRLESTVDQDLDTLSLASLITTTLTSTSSPHASLSSISSLEYPRGIPEAPTYRYGSLGPHGTPRARKVSSVDESPVSTAGHHVSAVTLGEGVYRTKGQWESGDEFDPERSLGRLVGELGKQMRLSPRPTSPFATAPRSPRSPSPLSSQNHNLSLTLNRSDPLPSPPASRSASGSSDDHPKHTHRPQTHTRPVLGETGRHNETRQRTDRRSKPHLDGDLTGMTGLLETPAKGGRFGTLDKNTNVGGMDPGSTIPQALATLQARLRALETEASLSRRRVKELEDELDQAREEVQSARLHKDARLREVIGEKTALEDLVKSLRSHLARLTADLEHQKGLVAELRAPHRSPPRPNRSVNDELAALRREIERLSREIQRLSGIVEQGLEKGRKSRGDRTMETAELRQVAQDVERRTTPGPSKLRQGLHAAAVDPATLMPPSTGPPTRVQQITPTDADSPSRPKPKRKSRPVEPEGPESPFPSIRAEDEDEFFAALGRSPRRESVRARQSSGGVPPQTVLARVLSELEEDFAHYKAIYAELADQYKVMDAASAVAKRHVLAEHLREIIDTLEQKADQIAALYDLLTVHDRPVRPDDFKEFNGVKKSVPDILRMVRETVGEEGMRRLAKEGVGRQGHGIA